IDKLLQLIEQSKQPKAKHSIEEVKNNHPITNSDKAKPNHTLTETVDKQITDIINQY
ncbi:454_t:CDS:1, partial [Cetraspora pellucida]